MEKAQHYIDGEFVAPASGAYFESYDPYRGEPWALVARGDAADVDRAVRAAHRAFTDGAWPALNASQRGALLRRLGDLVAREARRLAELEVRDNGKLIAEMAAQLAYAPNWYYYFGGLADKIEGAVLPIDKKGYFNFTRPEPLGVCAAICPWNSPLLILAFKLAPALAAGNTVVVKPSEFTSLSTLEFVKLVAEAGFPPGVVNVVTGFGKDVGMPLVEHPLVAKVAFTGSDATGRVINEAAARHFKRVTMELGGKSPNIVFEDADLDDAVNGAVSGIFAATGQTCIAGSRLLLQESIHDAFMEKLLALARTARMGDPLEYSTQVGPVTTRPQYDKVLSYIDIALKEGAKLELGGGRATRPECGAGWFIEPTIFSGVENTMRIAQEEVFGPVLSVIRFGSEAEAIRIANDVRFGLAAGVWTRDLSRMLRVAEAIRVGTVWVNTYRSVSYLSPFGGYKDSGLGRENGQEMIREYLQVKSVWINVGAPTANPFVMR
ncbi:MAG: aldehyde dehydrogenase [Candidatus Rokubacteria bacterium]|nr:aldehyde dehydrogenase [Candidatus Rokubacteria bacterium]